MKLSIIAVIVCLFAAPADAKYGDGKAFNGAIAEVERYDIVLTPAEILALAGK